MSTATLTTRTSRTAHDLSATRPGFTVIFPVFVLVRRNVEPITIVLDGRIHAALFTSRDAAERLRRRRQTLLELPTPAVLAYLLDRFDDRAEKVVFDPRSPSVFTCSRQCLAAELRSVRRILKEP